MKRAASVILVFVLWSPLLAAQPEDPAHGELRAFRDALVDAVNGNNRDRLVSLLHKNVTVTWLNGEVSRGPEQVRAFYDRMMTGEKRVVASIAIRPTVDEKADLYGSTAVAFGSSEDDYKLVSGMDFKVTSRWRATAVKEDGHWLIVNFHNSLGAFDNPLLAAAKRTALWAAVIAALVGAVVGFFIGRVSRRRA